MSFPVTNHDPFLIRHCRWLLLCGLASFELWKLTHVSAFACGIPLIFLGAGGGSLLNYRSERGLWMLSALIATMVGLFLTCALIGIISDIARLGFFADGLLMQLAWCLALLVLLYLLLALVKVTRVNWKISRRLANEGT